jgi:AraC-like DNA-binding protein
MSGPCPHALAMIRVPARRFYTRGELMVLMNEARAALDATEKPLGLTELAALVGLSPCHLQRLFQKTFGVSPAAYHRLRRLSLGAKLIQGGSRVEDVACSLGYADSSAFSRAFAREFGAPPTRFHKK